MADDQEAMLAMMQQMQSAAGGPSGMSGMAGGGAHRKRQSNASLSIIDLQAKKAVIDPLTEIEDYRAEKDLLLQAYDKIDVEDNGDIELEEFGTGMHMLKVSLTQDEIEQVFKLMDSDASNYVDRNEFTMFLSQRFESTQLTRYQDAILRKLGGRSRKAGGSIMNADDLDPVALAAMEREMRAAQNEIIQEEEKILNEEDKLFQELQEKEEEDENFGKIENAAEWNRYEVANWIDNEVKLNEYMINFMKGHVDGSILLSDLGHDFLIRELGVKRVHVEKIMRAIVKLRDKIRTEWDESECFDIIPYPIMNDDRAIDRIKYLEGEISRRDQQIEDDKKMYEARIEKLLGQISEKEEIIKQAEQDGFIMEDGEDQDSAYATSDSADVTDDEMPPLIDAFSKQQTMMYMDEQDPNGPTSQIAERHSIVQIADVEVIHAEDPTDAVLTNPTDDADATNSMDQSYEMVDNEEKTADQTRMVRSQTVVVNGMAPTASETGSNGVVVEKMLSNPSSPSLTPSASQQQLHKSKSSGSVHGGRKSRKHHRKNSTKAGFWAQAKKKPPAGTKAYWLYLQQKADTNANFAHPLRVQSWHHHEIAYWLKNIKCDKYALAFIEEKVCGEQLIHDMSSLVLSSDLGVKMLHCGKIMREIESLKIQAGITFSVEEKVNTASYTPSNEESVTYQLKEMENRMQDIEEKHTEELNENQVKYDELKEENDKMKTEVETLEKQVVELEKRKAKKSDDSDDSDDESDEEEDAYEPPPPVQPVIQEEPPAPETTQEETEAKEDGAQEDGDADETDEKAALPLQDRPSEPIMPKPVKKRTGRPKGYFRKYPKEIRKLMREIDDMERKSNAGTYGDHNVGKFGAPHRAYKWKTQEVCLWLEKSGFLSYIDSFHRNGIDGEILLNDLNPSILHEDLEVKRFHTGKMLREIQSLRQGGNFIACENIIDIAYEVQFSASAELDKLRVENQEITDKLGETEGKVDELINRPQISENEKIVEITEWDEMIAEKQRLAQQVDEYEEKMHDMKTAAVPEQEKAEAVERLAEFNKELEQMKQNDESFGDVIRVRQWNTNEVCWFFHSIGLGDYVNGIKEEKLNGEILIEDMSPELLSRDIGVKRIHINQILRQVDDLKHKAFGYEEDDNVIDIPYVPEEYATDKNAAYEATIEGLENEMAEKETQYNELNTQHEALGQEKSELIGDKNALLSSIEGLKKDIEDLKAAQQQEMEEAAQTRIAELETQIETLNKTVSDNEAAHLEEKQQMESGNQEVVEQKDANITELNTQIEELGRNLTDANTKIDEYADQERQLREEEEAKDNSYEAQLRRMARDDATFCVPKRAHKWTIEEVSHWLYTIKIPEYVDAFKDGLVDGAILLSDLSAEQLRSELQIKQYHIGKITREIAKLKELAIPPLEESELVDLAVYVPDKPAVELIAELKGELTDQEDINSALNMEVQNLRDQYETIKEIQAMGAAMHETAGGPNDSVEVKEDAIANNTESNQNNVQQPNGEEIEKLSKENAELNEMLQYLQKSKIDLAMRTANEMQTLRAMVRVASQAYEEVTGTPLGQVAQWSGTKKFFYNTLGYSPKKPSNNNNQYR
eukprot:515533_1